MPPAKKPTKAKAPADHSEDTFSDETYEPMSVEERDEELANRELEVGGTPDEQMDRLEADDAAVAAEVPAEVVVDGPVLGEPFLGSSLEVGDTVPNFLPDAGMTHVSYPDAEVEVDEKTGAVVAVHPRED
jgi:hypothetical protein